MSQPTRNARNPLTPPPPISPALEKWHRGAWFRQTQAETALHAHHFPDAFSPVIVQSYLSTLSPSLRGTFESFPHRVQQEYMAKEREIEERLEGLEYDLRDLRREEEREGGRGLDEWDREKRREMEETVRELEERKREEWEKAEKAAAEAKTEKSLPHRIFGRTTAFTPIERW
ncbi:hypothetical protein JCM8547_007128 [Rhodosporidiobolus lusitaniae]